MLLESGDREDSLPSPSGQSALDFSPRVSLPLFEARVWRDCGRFTLQKPVTEFIRSAPPRSEFALGLDRDEINRAPWAWQRPSPAQLSASELCQEFIQRIISSERMLAALFLTYRGIFEGNSHFEFYMGAMKDLVVVKQNKLPMMHPQLLGGIQGYPDYPDFVSAYEAGGGFCGQARALSGDPGSNLNTLMGIEEAGMHVSFRCLVAIASCASRLQTKLYGPFHNRRIRQLPSSERGELQGMMDALKVFRTYPGGDRFKPRIKLRKDSKG